MPREYDQAEYIEVYAVEIIENLDKQTYDKLLELIPTERKDYISSFKNIEDSQRSLLGDSILRYIFSNKFGLKMKDTLFTKNKFGKPIILGCENVNFNISHSGRWVVCVFSNKPVGIDVEEVKDINLDVAKHFYHSSEYDLIKKCELENQISLFYDIWTLKESYVKAIGKGLATPINSFTVSSSSNQWGPIEDINGEVYYFKQYELSENYKLSVCSPIDKFPQEITYIEYTSL